MTYFSIIFFSKCIERLIYSIMAKIVLMYFLYPVPFGSKVKIIWNVFLPIIVYSVFYLLVKFIDVLP